MKDDKKDLEYKMPDIEPMYVNEAEVVYGSARKIDPNRIYTFDEVWSWNNEYEKYEIIDGKPYLMAGAGFEHQEVMENISFQLKTHLQGRDCRVLTDMMVRKEPNAFRRDTYLIPDLVILCDRSKATKKAIVGAPDLVIEILSPSTKRFDRTVKRNEYAKMGVKEYWIVDPEEQRIEAHIWNEKGAYEIYPYEAGIVRSEAIENLHIDLDQVFADSWIDEE